RTRPRRSGNRDSHKQHNFKDLKSPEQGLTAVRGAITHLEFGAFRGEGAVFAHSNLANGPLEAEVEKFLDAVGPGQQDYLLIYYAGHGALQVGGNLALCGIDAESADRAFDTGKLESWVREKARGSPTLLILDCRYA